MTKSKKSIILLGTANPYRGGLAAFNERLAYEFQNQGHSIEIYNFSLQYPEILFPGTSQYLDQPHGDKVPTFRKVNAINPFNWIKVGLELYRKKPDIVLFRYWISFMAPCYFFIAWLTKLNRKTQIHSIVDNAISHEPKFFEKPAAMLFFSVCDKLFCMSKKVADDLSALSSTLPIMIKHPLYDNYTPPKPKANARKILNIPSDEKIILFFGFIRDYKGLDLLLEAIPDLNDLNIKLVVAGEFYSKKEVYENIVAKYKIQNRLYWHTDFIPDEKVGDYFSAADAVVLPYKSATQSGVTQIAFYYHTPIIATNVGGISEMVINGQHGLIVEPSSKSISDGIRRFYEEDLGAHFQSEIEKEKENYSWDKLANKIIESIN